jgi:GTPase SAR1 family protein
MSHDNAELSLPISKNNLFKMKIVFVGEICVGKSSLIDRFIKDSFDQQK